MDFWWPLMRMAAPVGLAGVFGTVLFRVDTAILAWFETPDVVGNYGAAYRLFEAAFFVSWAVGTAVYPVFSRLSPTSDPPVRVVFDGALKLVLALMLPLAVGGVILGQPLVELIYGADYDRAGEALLILSPAIAFHGLAHVAALLLVSQNRQVVLAVVQGVVAALNIALNFLLIPWLSLEGAALSALVSQVLLTLLFLGYATRSAGGLDPGRVFGGPAPGERALSDRDGRVARRPVAGDRGRRSGLRPCARVVRAHGVPRRREGDPRLPAEGTTVIAVVTGGSRGIGKAIADALRASGAAVTTLDRSHGVDVTEPQRRGECLRRAGPGRSSRQQRGHHGRDRARLAGRSGRLAA